MRRIRRILLFAPRGTDAAAATATATRLARDHRAQLAVLDVVADLSSPLAMLGKGADRKAIQAALVAHRKDELRRFVEQAVPGDVNVAVDIAAGTAFIEVIRYVLKHGQQMMIKPAGGAETRRARLLGGNDMHLLRKCPCPVWLVKSGQPSAPGLVLAAVDPVGAENRKLSAKVLELAADIATRDGAVLHVVHGWNFPYEDALRSRNVMSDKAIADMRVQIQGGHREGVDKLLVSRRLTDLKPKIHLREGRPSKLILEVAAKEKADLIVMGTVGRTGVSGLVIGNTAERVLHEVRCSVMAVKPDGFETPVR